MYRLLSTLILLMSVFFTACGADEEVDEPAPTKVKQSAVVYGLHGDTYRNREYVFKVSSLPVDDWTVLEISNAAKQDIDKVWKAAWIGANQDNEVLFNSTVSFLLMQPTSEDNFARTITEAITKQMPFIYILVEVQRITDIRTPKAYVQTLIEILEIVLPPDSFEVTQEGSLPSKDRRPGYYFETKLSDGSWGKQTVFLRNTQQESPPIYRLYFWAPGDQYEELLPVYNQIVSSVEFRLN